MEKKPANAKQIAGEHYRAHGKPDIQHWDMVQIFNMDYFQGQITKYVMRWRHKNQLQDLEKAAHFLQKYIELNTPTKPPDENCIATPDGDCVSTEPCMHSPIIEQRVSGFVLGQVVPSGWIQFVFEGADADGFLYTCRECKDHFRAPPHTNPHFTHDCEMLARAAAPTGAYVNQR